MFWDYLILLKEIQWGDILDISLASIFILLGLHALRTIRSRKIGIGLIVYGVLIFSADQLGLKLTVWILQGVTALIVLIFVVAYQKEIRRLIERLPGSILGKRRTFHEGSPPLSDLLVDTLETLSGVNRGALIVLAGTDPLHGITAGEIPLKGHLSKALLLSIFDPNSPGHDGALVIREGQVHSFGSRLPLSDQSDQLRERGTRHAAALGLSEISDALILVVSEETGHVSVAKEGRLMSELSSELLRKEIDTFSEKDSLSADRSRRSGGLSFWGVLEGVAAVLIAAILWLFLVPGTEVQTATYEIPVELQNIPEGYALNKVTPDKVAVTLIGGKRNFFQVKSDELVIRLDGTLSGFGRQVYPITKAHLLLPPHIEIADLVPEQVRVSVQKLN